LEEILRHAARLFSQSGFEGASIRDLSRSTGISLAGLYHYFRSKEELLYRLQKFTFTTVLANARATATVAPTPRERVRALVAVHVGYFLAHRDAVKVLSHEDDTLARAAAAGRPHTREWADEIAKLKHDYFRFGLEIVAAAMKAHDDANTPARARTAMPIPLPSPPMASASSTVARQPGRATGSRAGLPAPALAQATPAFVRVATLSLFGMLNWIYTWYRDDRDPGAQALAAQMADIYLEGIAPQTSRVIQSTSNGSRGRAPGNRQRPGRGPAQAIPAQAIIVRRRKVKPRRRPATKSPRGKK
jgi:AcrR family transcriptional regulator